MTTEYFQLTLDQLLEVSLLTLKHRSRKYKVEKGPGDTIHVIFQDKEEQKTYRITPAGQVTELSS